MDVSKYRIETLGKDARWEVVASLDSRQLAIDESRRLAESTGKNHYVVLGTKSGDRKLFKARAV